MIVLKGNTHSALLVDEIIGMTDVRHDEIGEQVDGAEEEIRQLVGGSLDKDDSRYFVLDIHNLLSEDNFIHAAVS